MNAAAWTLLALAGVFAVGNWTGVARGDRRLIYVCKPATLALLILVALVLDPAHADTRAWFVVALTFSLAGDMFLMLPRDAFVAGLSSFLLGHLAYVIGLNLHSEDDWLLAVPVLLVAVLLGGRLVGGIRRSGHTKLLGPVVAYVLVITAMVASAAASGNALAVAGAALFMASDALIGETRFVRPRSWGPLAIITTYHAGQALLVLSLTT